MHRRTALRRLAAGAALLHATRLRAEVGDDAWLAFGAGGSAPLRLSGSFEQRLPLPALQGLILGPCVAADGRHAFFAADDGWLHQVELGAAGRSTRVRTAGPISALAASRDGRLLIVGHTQPSTLEVLEVAGDDLRPLATIEVAARDGRRHSAVAELLDAPARRSFVVALRDLPEVWELSYDPRAEEIYDGLVHDFRMGEGVPRRGFLGPRRTTLPAPLQRLRFEPQQVELLGRFPTAAGAAPEGGVQVLNLDVRRRVAEWHAAARPDPALGLFVRTAAGGMLVCADAVQPRLWWLELEGGGVRQSWPLPARARFVRGHRATRWLWVGTEDGALLPVHKTEPGRAAAPVPAWRGAAVIDAALAPDGRRLAVAIATEGGAGALLLCDADSGTELQRVPFAAPQRLLHLGFEAERGAAQWG